MRKIEPTLPKELDKAKYDSRKIFMADPIYMDKYTKLVEFNAKLAYLNKDYLLLTGDPAIIGVACSIAADITGGKYNLLKWDRQEHTYYPVEINLYEKGNIDDG